MKIAYNHIFSWLKTRRFLFIFSLFLLSGIFLAYAQEKSRIKILHADYFIPESDENRQKLIGNVRLQHKEILMNCDSLYSYTNDYIEAFGNVHVIQNDSLHLWGDFMTYDGNTGLTKVRRNVLMDDGKVKLTTHFLDYNSNEKIGYYFNTGTLKDSINTLVSRRGYYYTDLNRMFFKDSVRVHTPEYLIHSDTLIYGTESKIISIVGPTTIYGEDRTLYSEDGWHNSATSHAELYKNNRITYNEYWGVADTITIDSISGMAIMRRDIHLYDTVNMLIVEGEYGELQKNNEFAYVTDRALMTMVGKQDSLFIHGDTLSLSKDTLGENIIRAYYRAKFFSRDLQGLCDSMTFAVADSTVYLSGSPIVWASGNQMSATEIDMFIRESEVKEFHLNNKAMMVNQVDTVKFNQIKGRTMTGYLEHNELHLINVNGNGETLYYNVEDGDFLLFHAVCAYINIYIAEKKITDIKFYQDIDGTLTPFFMVKPEERYLRDFEWHIDKQPKKKEDIFLKETSPTQSLQQMDLQSELMQDVMQQAFQKNNVGRN